MLKLKVFLVLFLTGTLLSNAQYTETINSNRPGQSQGAFAVGNGVLQFEAGGYYGNDEHIHYDTSTDILGADYSIRYGILTENLEINLRGSFQSQTTSYEVATRTEENTIANFKTNTLGAKFLLFDPYRELGPEKPNLYSWKANQRFKWRRLIPAVSVYGGANFSFGDNPYLHPAEEKFTPQAAIITQNNWGRWVLVMNFIADKFVGEFPAYIGIATLTHAVTPEFAIFGEYQGIINDLYADDLLRGGAAYLFTKDLQADISGLVNFKDTPSRWQVAAGISYRVDLHKEDEFLEDNYKGERQQGQQNDFGRMEGNQQ